MMQGFDAPVGVFEKTPDQKEAVRLLGGPAKHIMLYGGSRSGKTFILVYAIILRALKKKSRHIILRATFSHAISSVWYQTLPKVMDICFPNLPYYGNKSHWYIKLPNGSEIWVGGLDDKERTEKILGNEYSTIYFNECSQISYKSISLARTRLAEKAGLRNKFYYDCNPPLKTHWTYKVFELGIEPVTNPLIKTKTALDRSLYTSMMMHPSGNVKNLEDDFMDELERLPEEERKRFLDGEYGEISDRCIMRNWEVGGDIILENGEPFLDGAHLRRLPSGLDFGYSPHPATLVDLYLLEDHTLVWDERFYQTGLTAVQSKSDLPHSIQNKLEEIRFEKDHMIIADSARNDSIMELRSAGYNIFGGGKPGVVDGINMLLSFNHILTTRSENIKHEFENYVRAVDKNGTILPDPIKEHDHAIDAGKYVVWMKGRLW